MRLISGGWDGGGDFSLNTTPRPALQGTAGNALWEGSDR